MHISTSNSSFCHSWCTNGFCVVDRFNAMNRKEITTYQCNTIEQRFYHSELNIEDMRIRVSSTWREILCSWSYEIIDYFDLSRRTVAISLDLFDRFCAKRDNVYNESYARLTSLTTLYIAIKSHETKKIKLCTLTKVLNGYFLAEDILQMEIEILTSLKWTVNPPTTVDFISDILHILPVNLCIIVRRTIFDLSCYAAEMSVCDSFFIGIPRSIVAFAAIINVLDYEISPACCPIRYQKEFLNDLFLYLNLKKGGVEVTVVRKRLCDLLKKEVAKIK